MSMVFCPECGARISVAAKACPRCGFVGKDDSLPISKQGADPADTLLKFEIENWAPDVHGVFALRREDNNTLVSFLTNLGSIRAAAPSIAQAVEDMASRKHFLIAKAAPFIKKLINEGAFRLQIGSAGEIAAILDDPEGGKLSEALRIQSPQFEPDLSRSLSHLADIAMMGKILSGIKAISLSIERLQTEPQDDKAARAEGALARLAHAGRIENDYIRDTLVIGAIGGAIDANKSLMKDFEKSLGFVAQNHPKNDLQLIADGIKRKDVSDRAEDAMQDLFAITNGVRAMCAGYIVLGEYEAAKGCLADFDAFVKRNRLDSESALSVLVGGTDEDHEVSAATFSEITRRIESLKEKRSAVHDAFDPEEPDDSGFGSADGGLW